MHSFLAGFFAHCTSIVIFVVDGLVFVEECKDEDILLAWGSGSPEDNVSQFANSLRRANNNLFNFLYAHNDINVLPADADVADGQ